MVAVSSTKARLRGLNVFFAAAALLIGETHAQQDTRWKDPGSGAHGTSPQYTHVENLQDDGTHVPHEHVLEAIHNRSYESHPFYEDVPDHGPYQLQVDLNVKLDTFSLDEHHIDVAEVGPNHIHFLRGAVHEHLTEGSIMLGSHEGRWLDRLSSEDEGVEHLRPGADTGIILSRRIVSISKREDGSANVTTEAVHPFHAFEKIQYQLDWTPTPKKKQRHKDPTHHDGERRMDLDLSKCGDKLYESTLDQYNIELRKYCLEWEYEYDLFNFNYAADCSLVVHIDRGTIHSDYDSFWDWHPDSYVKAVIGGESKTSAAVANSHAPAWESELDMGCPSYEDDALNLIMYEEDIIGGDDLMFTCTVTGWSEFDSTTTQVCEGTTAGGLTHEIQYRIDYNNSPPSDTRAIVRSYDLGAMFAGYLTEQHGMDAAFDGLSCEDCYARIGSDITIQFGYTSTGWWSGYTHYFLINLSGEVDINVQLLAEDPSFALLYVASLSEDTSYSTALVFSPYLRLQYKKKLDFQLEITGSAQGTAGIDFSVNAFAEIGAEYRKDDAKSSGAWDFFANVNFDYSYNVYNNLYDATMEMTATLHPTTYLRISFLELLYVDSTVTRSPYQGVKYYGASSSQFSATVAEISNDSPFGSGDVMQFEIIYENAEMGESMVTYIELVSDCDRLRAFRIGEVLVEEAASTGSVDFDWVVPWDSSLLKESECIGQWRAHVYFSGHATVTAETDTFTLNLYDRDEGVFSAPANGDVVVPDSEYVLTWDTSLLKYFVDGKGTNLGYEKVSENVTIFLVGNGEDEIHNMTLGATENTGSLPVTFPSSLDTSQAWFMQILSTENTAVWSWSPGVFYLSDSSRRKLDSDIGITKDRGIKERLLLSPGWDFEEGVIPLIAREKSGSHVDPNMLQNHRRLASTCMTPFSGQDGYESLDKVSIRDWWTIYESEGQDTNTITPTTLSDESCTPTPAPTPAPPALAPVAEPTAPPVPAEAPVPAPVPEPTAPPVPAEAPVPAPVPEPTAPPVPAEAPAPAPVPAPVSEPTAPPVPAEEVESATTSDAEGEVDAWPGCDFGSLSASDLSNAFCDTWLNNEACGYDQGDCCSATCVRQPENGSGFTCSSGDEHCVDPEHATPSAWEDCDFGDEGWLTGVHLNDTWCHTELNNELCGFDGGDCCAATCVDRGSDVCDTHDDRFCVDASHNTGLAWPDCSFGNDLYIWHLNDAECHTGLNTALCGFDGGDCCTATCEDKPWGFCSRTEFDCVDPDHVSALPWADCDFGLWGSWNLNNSVCNTHLNTPECHYDGGDCCISSCQDSVFNSCSRSDFYCTDPDHVPTPSPSSPSTPAPAVAFASSRFAWPDCDLGGSPANFVGDSDCDTSLNTEECGYDGGDCCAATCVIKLTSQDCTDGNAYCLDERYRYDCDFGELTATDRGDGFCDQQLNTVVCGYDGGDCCFSTCVSGTYTCSGSEIDYPDCRDPSSGAFSEVPKLNGLLVTLSIVCLQVAQNLSGR